MRAMQLWSSGKFAVVGSRLGTRDHRRGDALMPVSNKFARLHPAMLAMQLARSNELAYRSQVLSDDHQVGRSSLANAVLGLFWGIA